MGRSSALQATAGFLLVVLAARAGVQWALGQTPAAAPQTTQAAALALPGGFNGSTSMVYTLYRAAFGDDEPVDNTTCEYQVMQQYNCAEPGCHDLAAGASPEPLRRACFHVK